MKLWWRIRARYYQVRARRAFRRADIFQERAEKFFRLIKGSRA